MSTGTTTDPFNDPFAPSRVPDRPRPAGPAPGTPPPEVEGRIPGEMGIWVFVFIDMWFFTGLMGVTVYNHGKQGSTFEAGRESLTLWEGTLNTLLLLTASFVVVRGIQRLNEGDPAGARLRFRIAMLCAAGFVINKAVEYSHVLGDGHNPGTNDFYLFFFILTGFHLVHLLVGTAGLNYMARLTRRDELTPKVRRNLEVAATYWHLVDFLWVVIFAVLYLMR